MRASIRLQTTETNFGGQRWWFACPLIVDGGECKRRVGKLYLPPGARRFGCRKCHDLTYRSSQASHRMERLFDWGEQRKQRTEALLRRWA